MIRFTKCCGREKTRSKSFNQNYVLVRRLSSNCLMRSTDGEQTGNAIGLKVKTMNKLTSLLRLTGYILAFIACEFFLHYIQTKVEIGTPATVSLRAMEWMSAPFYDAADKLKGAIRR